MPNISTVQGLSGGKTGGDETMVSSVKRGGLLLFKYLNGVFRDFWHFRKNSGKNNLVETCTYVIGRGSMVIFLLPMRLFFAKIAPTK